MNVYVELNSECVCGTFAGFVGKWEKELVRGRRPNLFNIIL